MERPAGALWFSAPESNQERKEKKKQEGKKGRRGLALIAAEFRRDSLIAPSGCGQR